jgi:hypothetical protein
MKVWICLQYNSGMFPSSVFEFRGVFSTEELAFKACKNDSFAVIPVIMDDFIPNIGESILKWNVNSEL